MRAGCIKKQISEWEKITSDPEVLSTVSGLPLDFIEEIDYATSKNPSNFSQKEEIFLSSEIEKLLSKGIIEECQHEQGEYISPIFLTPKSDGGFRMILNLKKLNNHMPYIHFKMETIKSVLNLVTPNCYMASIDIKDAYYSIPILPEHQKLLKFSLGGKLYKFTCLPNGLCSGPRKFTKVLKPPLAELRLEHISIAAYIDDLITLARSFNICFDNVWKCAQKLDKLGFVIHPKKSVFIPSQEIEYLGFLINSVTMTIKLTTDKKKKIFDLCQEVLLKDNVSIRIIAKLLGKFTSSFQGVKYGKLHYRGLERLKIRALKYNKGNFDKKTSIDHYGKQDIIWWKNNVLESFNHIRLGNPLFTITADASKTGWGAVFNKTSTGGYFNLNEICMHINVLELKAILFGLQSLCDKLHNTHLKILSDNTTAVQCINNMGSCKSVECDQITKTIWDWGINRNVWLTSAHIPGRLNREADEESRKTELRTEWKLNRKIFNNMLNYFQFFPEIDLFASRINTQLPRFFSYRPDPFSEVTNAFTVSWGDIKFYCFPPFSCIGRILQKICEDKATGILVVPNWPTQIWYPLLIDLLVNEPFIISPSVDQLHLPNNPQESHPLWQKLTLMGCMVSGRGM